MTHEEKRQRELESKYEALQTWMQTSDMNPYKLGNVERLQREITAIETGRKPAKKRRKILSFNR